MARRKVAFSLWVPILIMLALILDSKTGLTGTLQGVELCIRTVIPSLFPFFVISVLLTSAILENPIAFLAPLGKLCGIPSGAEGIFLLGLVGGYPVGAQAVTQAWESGNLSTGDAKRMLGFCSNCGPSFLFGITSVIFHSSSIPWILWGIHLLSALLTGILLPGKSKNTICFVADRPSPDLSKAVTIGARNLANVCGWILLARCATAYLEKWVLSRASVYLRTGLMGFVELANGCIALTEIPSESVRFLMASGFLAFGGICVSLQTVSVTGKLGTGWYFPGKLLQCIFSVIMADILTPVLYPGTEFHPILLLLPVAAGIMIRKLKKTVAFSADLMYNQSSNHDSKEPTPCFSAVR